MNNEISNGRSGPDDDSSPYRMGSVIATARNKRNCPKTWPIESNRNTVSNLFVQGVPGTDGTKTKT